jgi:hypothetical protein
LAVASLFDKDAKFPSFREFYPTAKKVDEKPPVDEQLERAMQIARDLGVI